MRRARPPGAAEDARRPPPPRRTTRSRTRSGARAARHPPSAVARAARVAGSEAVRTEGGDEEAATEELAALLTSCFSLGQFVGPLGGALLASRCGFRVASDALSLALLANAAWLYAAQGSSRAERSWRQVDEEENQ